LVRHTDDGDFLLCQEILHEKIDLGHDSSLSAAGNLTGTENG
jgi:hypothetical protein